MIDNFPSHIPLFSSYTDVYYWNKESEKFITINQGGTSCHKGDTLVVTDTGNVAISEVKEGDIVKSYNEDTKTVESNKVLNIFRYSNHKKTVRIKLKNGKTLTCTDDHKFYHQGQWLPIKDILCKTKK